MIAGKLEEILKIINAETDSAFDLQARFCGLSIDSRTMSPGNIFVAIKGEVHDGHKFIPQAVEKGASIIICDKGNENPIPESIKSTALVVDDTKLALRQLGSGGKKNLISR